MGFVVAPGFEDGGELGGEFGEEGVGEFEGPEHLYERRGGAHTDALILDFGLGILDWGRGGDAGEDLEDLR